MGKYNIIHNLIILTQKQKIKHKINILNKHDLLFLNFLCRNNYIYGYTFVLRTNKTIIIYLKNKVLNNHLISYNFQRTRTNIKILKKQSK